MVVKKIVIRQHFCRLDTTPQPVGVIMNAYNTLCNQVQRDDLLQVVTDLMKIPSHSEVDNQEKQAGVYLADLLEEEGLSVSLQSVEDNRPNVIASLKNSGKPMLMLNGHLDTVPPGDMSDPFCPRIDGGNLFGRGAADMKGAVGAMVYAMILIKRSSVSLERDLLFAGVIGEESGSPGTRFLVDHGPQAEWAIVGEPTDLRPVIAHKGIEWIEILIGGKTAHGSIPDQGINAVTKASEVIVKLNRRLTERLKKRSHELLGRPTMNIGVVKGGERPSIVPSKCIIQVDRRWLPSQQVDDVINEVREVLQELKKDIDNLDIRYTTKMEQTANFPHTPLDTDLDHPLTNIVSGSVEKVGRNSSVDGVTYWTDAALLSDQATTPSVVCGPGNISQAHSAEEHVPVNQLLDAVKIYLGTALQASTDIEKL